MKKIVTVIFLVTCLVMTLNAEIFINERIDSSIIFEQPFETETYESRSGILPPRNLTGSVVGSNVQLSWDAPPATPIIFSQRGSDAMTQIPYGGAINAYKIHRFTPAQLNTMGVAGGQLLYVAFGAAPGSTYRVDIRTGGFWTPEGSVNLGTEVYAHPTAISVTGEVQRAVVALVNPVPIPTDAMLWICVWVQSPLGSSTVPSGLIRDNGTPHNQTFGDILWIPGAQNPLFINLGMGATSVHNFWIEGIATGATGSPVIMNANNITHTVVDEPRITTNCDVALNNLISTPFESIDPSVFMDGTVNGLFSSSRSELTYQVRRGETVLTIPAISATTFTDIAPPPAIHTYSVRTVSGEEMSDPVSITLQTGPLAEYPWREGFEGTAFPSQFGVINDGWVRFTQAGFPFAGTVAAASWANDAGAVDNWMIFPQFAIPESDGDAKTFFRYFTRTGNSTASEQMSVLISTTGNNKTDFTITAFNETLLNQLGWAERVVDLSAYEGENVYIAIRHHRANGSFAVLLDNVWIGQAVTEITEFPFAEGFDTTFMPSLPISWGWIINGFDTGVGAGVTVTNHTGGQSVFMNNGENLTGNLILVSPIVDGLDNKIVSFYTRLFDETTAGIVVVGCIDDEFDFTPISTITITDEWVKHYINFEDAVGERIGFRHGLGGATRIFFIDTIVVDNIPGEPVFAIDPTDFDFGDVCITTYASKTFTITNAGSGELTVNSIAVSGTNLSDFIVSEISETLPAVLESLESLTFVLTFNPTVVSDKVATLTIVHNADGPFVEELTGTAIDTHIPEFAIDPTNFDFGNVCITASVSRTFTITNDGIGDLTVTSILVSGLNQGDFVVSGISETLPAELESLETLTFVITFNPTVISNKVATLTIVHNAGGPFVAELTGTAVDSRITVPHLEDFTTIPQHWTRWNGVLGAATTMADLAPVTTASWVLNANSWRNWVHQPFRNVVTTPQNMGVAVNLWPLAGGVGVSHWLVTPEILLTTGSGYYKLSFDYALTEYDSSDPSESHVNDVIAVIYSTFDGTAWTPWSRTNYLVWWDNHDTDEDLSSVTNLSQNIVVNLPVNTGSIRIALYAESNHTSPFDFMFHVDNFKLEHYIPSELNVTLSSFTTSVMNTNGNQFVSLNWETATETNMSGFIVLRNDTNDSSTARNISNLISATNTTLTTNYNFIDFEVFPGEIYYYWIEMRSVDGSSRLSNAIPTNIPIIDELIFPEFTTISNAYPNPMRIGSGVNFDVEVKENEVATIQIFNIRGQIVYELSDIRQGSSTVNWHGRDNNNREVASGVYFYRLSSPSTHSVQRLVIIR